MSAVYPDYENSILNLTCSLMKHYGVPTRYPGIPRLDRALSGTFQNIVQLTLDGMGSEFLTRVLPSCSFLRSHQVTNISSVYPCTTTTATTSMLSGMMPIEHGWLGWNSWFKEYGRVVDLFLDRDSFCGVDVKPSPARQLLSYPDVSQIILNHSDNTLQCHKVLPPFAKNGVNNVTQMADRIRSCCDRPGRNLVLAYWYEPDTLMHKDGPYSKSVLQEMLSIDRILSNLFSDLKDTLMIITADHGQIEIDEEIYLDDHPELMDCLILPPSLEVRATSFFVKPDRHERFKDVFSALTGDHFKLISKADVLERQLLGYGTAHHKVDDFLGDYLACATGRTTLRFQSSFDRLRFPFKGHHSGLTTEEMIVPLILAG